MNKAKMLHQLSIFLIFCFPLLSSAHQNEIKGNGLMLSQDSPVYFYEAIRFKNPDSKEKYKTYLKQMVPIAVEYGAQPLPLYAPIDVIEGEFDFDLFGFVKWPNFYALQAFWSDSRYHKLMKFRNVSVQQAHQLIAQNSPDFSFPEITDASPPEEAVYLFNALWFKEDGGLEKYRDEYLVASFPIASQYGAMPLALYQPIVTRKFRPDLLALVRWPESSIFDAFLADPDYQQIAHLRTESLDKALLVRTQVAHEFLSEISDFIYP